MLKLKSKYIRRLFAAVLSGIRPQNTSLEDHIFDFIRQAVQTMPQNPTVRVTGGWVRDKMIPLVRSDVKVPPPDDIDITVTNMTGLEFVDAVEQFAISQFGPNQNKVRKLNVDFETKDEQVKAIAAGLISIFGEHIDVVSLRKEIWVDPETGERLLRNPIIEEGTPWDDAFRRDLTINGMAYNLTDDVIEDFVGGYSDLATMTLRTPAIPSGYPGGKPEGVSEEQWQYQEAIRVFRDDPTRLLRVLRFFSRYAPADVDPSVIRAMHDNTTQQLLTEKLRNPVARGIVVEKSAKEFRKIMGGEKPSEAVRIMFQTGLLDNVLNLPPDFASLDMDQRNPYHVFSLIEHTLSVIKNTNILSKKYGLSNDERTMMNLGALGHDLGKLDPRSQKTKPDGSIGYSGDPSRADKMEHAASSVQIWNQLASAFKLTNKETKFVGNLISGHMKPHDLVENEFNMSALKQFKDTNPLWKFLYIHAIADASSKSPDPATETADPYLQHMDVLSSIELPVLLSGNEIQQLLNLSPGPIIGDIMKAIRQAQYNNFRQPKELSIEEQKQYAIEIAKSFLPHLLNRQQVQDIVGLEPRRPPEGMPGYIQFVRDKIRDEQLKNPTLSPEDAERLVRGMIERGELSPYQNDV